MDIGQLVEQGTGEIFALGFEPVSIGRHGDNDIILPDPQVSRHHAEIVMQGGRWVVSDLGSANGTFVNGQQVAGPHVLNHGDLLRVGQTQFQVEIAATLAAQDTLIEAAPVAAPPPVPVERRSGLQTALLAVAAMALVLIAAITVWMLIRGDRSAPETANLTPGTSISANPTGVDSASPSPATRVKPTTTAISTLVPPTTEPTSFPPTEAPPAATDTPPPEPVIGFFRAQPSSIETGQCSRLEWGEVENANRITLDDVGQVGPSGKADVCLDTTKVYTLRATGTGGTVEESVEITVQEPSGPVIGYFRVIPSIISPGDCAQLEWGRVENSTSATIEPGIGGVGTPGTLEVCPNATTAYVLTAKNPEGNSTAQTTLLVASGTELKPVIAFFTANPASIQAGECTTLGWGKVDYATSVTIDSNIGGVATPGSKEVCLGSTTTFLMTAVGPGGTTENELTVAVSPVQLARLPDLVIESILFEPNPCYRAQNCRVRIKIRNDGPVGAGHFVVNWAPEGQGQVPVEWDVDSLEASQEKELVYRWIPSRADDDWQTVAIIDPNNEVEEIGEREANRLGQSITVLEP
jgi:pSer/pThr/pTyr-binding forkhead associated (FHA) protein